MKLNLKYILPIHEIILSLGKHFGALHWLQLKLFLTLCGAEVATRAPVLGNGVPGPGIQFS